MSRVNSEILGYFNKYSYQVLRDYVSNFGVKIILYSGTDEYLVDADWYGVVKSSEGDAILYIVKRTESVVVRGVQIGSWKYYLAHDESLNSGIHFMNLRLRFSEVDENNYS